MNTVTVCELSLDDYAETIGEKEICEIRTLAEKLDGKSVVHVNSTSFGGGVAEILHRLVPSRHEHSLDRTNEENISRIQQDELS